MSKIFRILFEESVFSLYFCKTIQIPLFLYDQEVLFFLTDVHAVVLHPCFGTTRVPRFRALRHHGPETALRTAIHQQSLFLTLVALRQAE